MKFDKKIIERDPLLGDKRWYAYALAGAGAIAATPGAHAAVFYFPYNSTITTPACIGLGCQTFSPLLNVDIDGNSVTDFTLQAEVSSGATFLHFAGVNGTPAGAYKNGVSGATPQFTAGQSIGPAAGGFSYLAAGHVLNTSAVWGPGDGFLGLSFHLPTDPLSTDMNFAWAELSRTFDGQVYSVTLKGIGYESTPGTAILAGNTGIAPGTPEPGTAGLALLALGACGLAAWRKRKQAQQAA